MGGSFIGDHTLRKQLNKILEDDSVKALVLRVNSPGGSGSASDSIWNDLRRIQDSGRPVVISMGDYAASGGYYISMGADYIYAMPGTLTGSIGVFGGKLNMEGLYEKIGINYTPISLVNNQTSSPLPVIFLIQSDENIKSF